MKGVAGILTRKIQEGHVDGWFANLKQLLRFFNPLFRSSLYSATTDGREAELQEPNVKGSDWNILKFIVFVMDATFQNDNEKLIKEIEKKS